MADVAEAPPDGAPDANVKPTLKPTNTAKDTSVNLIFRLRRVAALSAARARALAWGDGSSVRSNLSVEIVAQGGAHRHS